MYKAKTKPTRVRAAAYVARIPDEERRADCHALIAMLEKITGCPPVLWGPSIVGFGQVHYRYASGHEGDSCLVGFSSGKPHLTLYVLAGFESDEIRDLLAHLGKHKTSKACLYIRRLSEVRRPTLKKLIQRAVAITRRTHATRGSDG